MRIDAYNAINQVYQTTKPVNRVKSEKAVAKDDALEISQFGKDINVVKKAVQETSDVRAEKIDMIKKQMQEGTYSVSDEALADKIMQGFMGGM